MTHPNDSSTDSPAADALDHDQRQALEELKKRLLQETDDGSVAPADSKIPDDDTLLRFLRARRYDVAEAHCLYVHTLQWRRDAHVDEIWAGIDVGVYEASRKLYPQWTGRRDRTGHPLYVYELAHTDSHKVAALEKLNAQHPLPTSPALAQGLQPLAMMCEYFLRFSTPLCSEVPRADGSRGQVRRFTVIVDVSNFGFLQSLGLRSQFQAISTVNTANYPETINKVLVVNAPYFFSKVWAWAKGWMDPGTVGKVIVFSSSETKAALEREAELDNLPEKYGGTLKWSWNDKPAFEAPIRAAFGGADGDRLPEGPVECVVAADGTLSIVARGSKDGVKRSEVVMTTAAAAAMTTTANPKS